MPQADAVRGIRICREPRAVLICREPRAVLICRDPRAVLICRDPRAVLICRDPRARPDSPRPARAYDERTGFTLRNVEPTTDEAVAAARYEDAEAAFLAGLRTGQGRRSLTDLADAVAARAEAWNAAAYRAYHESIGDERDSLDYLTERTEVLEYLWFDIAGALHGREATHDG